MKITFIIPVYNCKEFLPACVDSIRAVGMEDYEILLIDDGATDGSGALCDELAVRFPEVRVVHQENGGASAARNRGIREAAGELLLFIDADDSIDPTVLHDVLTDPRCQEADLTVFGMSSDYYRKGECYQRALLYFDFDGVMDQKYWGNVLMQLFRSNTLSSMCTKVFKREIIQAEELRLDGSMFLYEDLEFVLRYLRHCDTIWNVPRAIYHYRQSENEGHARNRVKRIGSISAYLHPIEMALESLPETVNKTDSAAVLQLLYAILARDKVIVSDLDGIREVCRDFCRWAENRWLPLEPDVFQKRLLGEKAAAIYLACRKSMLRHWVAVRVKAFLGRIKNT